MQTRKSRRTYKIIEKDKSTKPIDGYQSIINGQIKSNFGDDSTTNILKVISKTMLQ